MSFMDRSGNIFGKLKGAALLLVILFALVTSPIGYAGGSDRQLTHADHSKLALPQLNETAVFAKRSLISGQQAEKRDGDAGSGSLPVGFDFVIMVLAWPTLQWPLLSAAPISSFALHNFQARAPPVA